MPIFINKKWENSSSCWMNLKMSGILEEAAKYRIRCIPTLSREELLALSSSSEEPSSLVLFLTSNAEILEARQKYAGISMPIIAFAHNINDPLTDNFSYVMSDTFSAMQSTVSHLREQGATRLALFSVDYKSNYDCSRAETFKHITENEHPLIIDRSQGFEASVHRLLSCKEPIDGLLCTSDLEALKLMRVLDLLDPDWGSKMLITGFTDTNISALNRHPLTSVSLNYRAGGKEVVSMHRRLMKNPEISRQYTFMESQIQVRETSASKNPCGICFSDLPKPTDDEIVKTLCSSDYLIALESLLMESDSTTLRLLLAVMQNKSINHIAKELFFSKDNILYHLRKIRKTLHINSNNELSDFLHRWIDINALEKFIIIDK